MLLVVVAGLVGAGYRWGAGAVREDWDRDTMLRNLESAEAAVRHAQEMGRRDAAIHDLTMTMEAKHHADSKKLAEALADSRRRVAAVGGLRDPGARAECQAVPATPGAAADSDGGAGGARLSVEAGEFLLSLAGEADAVVAQLERCRAWAMRLPNVGRVESPNGGGDEQM